MKITTLDGRTLPVLGLDFETYYEAGPGPNKEKPSFTLSKMTTTMYVRSPKFRAHGASIRFPGMDHTVWVSHCDLRDVLREIDWENTALLCQNTAFDGLILSRVYGHVPAYYLDTLSMSRGEWGVHVPHNLTAISTRLGNGAKLSGVLEKTAWLYHLPPAMEKELIPYANQDVDLMWKDFEDLYYDHQFPEKELHIIDVTIRAFCDPQLVVNHELCREEALHEASEKSRLAQICGESASVLSSNPQFAEALRRRGVEPPTKISPKTGKEAFAFAKGDLEFQALLRNPAVSDLVQARLAVKSTIGETRAIRLIDHSQPTLPVMLHYCGAHTQRWSAGDKINMENLPAGRKPGQSRRLRQSVEAPDGYLIMVIDSSQVEARFVAWASGQNDLVGIFRSGGDPYSAFASKVFGFEVNKHDHKPQRMVGKVGVLQLGYQSGWRKYAHTLRSGAMGPPVDISDQDAQHAHSMWRKSNKHIVNMWYKLEGALARMINGEEFELGPWKFYGNNVLMPSGLFIRYPGLTADEGNYGYENFRYLSRNGQTHIYGGMLLENLSQGYTRTIVAHQILEITRRFQAVNLVHDEGLFIVPEDQAEQALTYGLECFAEAPEYCRTLPVAGEGSVAKQYSK